jgi:hypothetical protein
MRFSQLVLRTTLALCLAASLEAQSTKISGFVDVSAAVANGNGRRSAVAVGQYDLFITSKLSDRINFLGETVFEFDDGAYVVDVERVIVSFNVNPALQIAVGKHHTPIGFWNTAYHHGALLQPTSARPDMFRFEDDGGILPVHSTGVLLAGRSLGAAHLGYDVLIGNGIGNDSSNAMSITTAVHSQVNSALRVGASFHKDRVPAGSEAANGSTTTNAVRMTLAGAFVNYSGNRVEFASEYQRITTSAASAAAEGTDAGYIYAGVRAGTLVPYVRVDQIAAGVANSFFAPGTQRSGLFGLRLDLAAAVVVKVEAERRRQPVTGVLNTLRTQVAVGF